MYYTYADKVFVCSIENNVKFAWNKLKKLYILHIITASFLFVVFLRSYILNDRLGEIRNHIVGFICNIFLVQTWIPDVKIYCSLNAVSWYLSDCMFFYICFPLIMKFIRAFVHNVNHAIVWIIGSLCFQVVSRILFGFSTIGNVDAWLYRLPAFRIFEFVIGCLCGYVYTRKEKITFNKTIMSFLQIVIIPLGFSVDLVVKNSIVNNVILTICSMIAVWSWTIDGFVSGFLKKKMIYKIADLSKYAFLMHQIVIADVGVVLGMAIEESSIFKTIQIVCAFIITLIMSDIFKIIVDKNIPCTCKKII